LNHLKRSLAGKGIAANATPSGEDHMRHLLKASFVVGLLAAMLPAVAQDEGPPVPVEKANYHWPVFRNDYVMLLRVYMAPGKGSNYHTHSLDQISILIEPGANAGQVYGKERQEPKAGKRGSVSFTGYSKKHFTHRSTNTADTPFNNLVVGLLQPQSGKFTAQAREVVGYTQLFDNERARAWRLVLEPGQSARPITRSAPGMRISLDRGEITEIIQGQMDRPLALNPGDFYWQDPGPARSVRNSGSTRVELVEFELK
jgi:quercetin dioxygenase-like cupin family protein